MDLLGEYGSDSESSLQDDSLQNNQVNHKPEAISRNGKKLVSLHSVLPSHIFEQLVTSNSHMDSDDEDERLSLDTSREKMKLQLGADQGLSSLLTELGSVTKQTKVKSTINSCDRKREKMGQAFLQVERNVIGSSVEDLNSRRKNLEVEKVHDTISKDNVSYSDLNGEQTHLTSVFKSSVNPTPYIKNIPPDTHPQAWQNHVGEGQKLNAANRRTSTSEDSSFSNKKISRRDMEKSLRAGKLDVVDTFDGTRNIDGETFVYLPEQHQNNGETGYGGIRVAPVAMYDTKSGKDIMGGISGKARGKNQINFLMASAAALEANKATQSKAKSYRVNAKRKYGW
mmetsp:Transcript_25095/g.38095  ORF Transcript_25095/g.38095 Transcript_25095/m.38095 type:complete len:340 (+) Transcript_25095:70-1089(+)